METISELIEYYKGIFRILSSCASRQLEEVTFRRATIPVTDIMAYAGKYFKRISRGVDYKITLTIEPLEAKVIGDINQLRFLIENLIDEALSFHQDGELVLKAIMDGEYVRFCSQTEDVRSK
ncbi:hypothetical protein ACIXN4_07275 [Bacteroides fragilis]